MIKKLKLFVALLVMSFSVLNAIPLIPNSVSAAPYTGSNNDPAEAEYIQLRALYVVELCIENSNSINVTSTNEEDITGNFFSSRDVKPGMVYSRYGAVDDDNNTGCDSQGDINKSLTVLGFGGIRDFQDKIRNKSGKPTASTLTVAEVKAALNKYMVDESLGGRGGSGANRHTTLSSAALYWYWNEVFRTKKNQSEAVAGSFSSCGGVMSGNPNLSGYKERSTGSYWNVSKDSSGKWVPKEYQYAYFEHTKDRQIGNLDGLIIDNATCDEILGSITQARAQSYADSLNAAVAAGVIPTPSGGSSGVDGAGGDGVECENWGSTLGWIICPIYNMFAEASQFFYQQILQPFLYAPPVDVSPGGNNPTFQAWSNFRFYGNIFLVLAMIAIVFGQSIGGGLIDAYTAKKIMPRILGAAIMINISIYLVAILVDVTNAAGNGIASLIMSPFDTGFQANNATAIGGVIGIILGGTIGAGSITGFIGATVATGGGTFTVGMMLLLTVVVPLLIALAGVFITLVIRRGLILALVLVSPIAFALYCLPNTEKYFKKWWELLVKALLVYPIVMTLFAVANVMSLTIIQSNGSGDAGGAIAGGLAGLVAFFVQLVPLFMVPFAFKFAGGAMGSLYAAIEGGGKKAGGLLKSRQDAAKKDYNNLALQARQRAYDRLGRRGDLANNGLSRWGNRFAQNRVGGRNLHLALAEMNAEQFKEADAQKSTGIDDEQRALTVNKTWANRQDAAAIARGLDANGNSIMDGNHVRTRAGRRQYRTLGGRWVGESSVDAAHQRWGGNMAQMQWSLGYEMSKAATQEEMDYLFNNYGRVNAEGSGMNLSQGQMTGMWTGAAFAQQNTDRQYKHYSWGADPTTGQTGLHISGANMFREIDERQGNWQMMSQSADTWTTMSEEVNRARRIVDGTATAQEQGQMSEADAREVIQRGGRIANALGGGYQTEDGRWVNTGVGQGASGRTKEEIENFAALFDPKKVGRDDYVREVGTERRGTQSRSGIDAATGAGYAPPPVDAATGLPMSRPVSEKDITGVRVDRPNPTRNNPRTP